MADLTNNSAETLAFAEAVGNAYAQQIAEAFDVGSFYPATARYVGSDLGIYNTAFDAAAVTEFIKNRSPIGYSPFRDFVAGEYSFRKALVDFVFIPVDGTDAQLALTQATLVADVPDKSETNSATISVAATGAVVTFATTFTVAPKVVVTPIGSTPVIAMLSAAPTITGFTAKLYDRSTGAETTGSLIWTATGY